MIPGRFPAQNVGSTPSRTPHPPHQSKLFDFLTNPRVLAVAWAFVIADVVITAAGLPRRENQWDFSHYYTSALAMRQGTDAYTADLRPLAQSLGLKIGSIDRGSYPPTFVLCFEPLTFLAPRAAYWTWIGFSTLCFALSLFMLLAGETKFDAHACALVVALAVLYLPVREHFEYAQSQFVILLLIVVMMRALARGRHSTAGFALAFATALKAFPALLVGYLLCRRLWRPLLWTAIWGAVIGLITFAAVGRASFDFVKALGVIESQSWISYPTNLSIAAFTSRVFWYAIGTHLTPGEDLARCIAVGVVELGAIALVVKATLSACDESDDRWRALSLWIAAMIFVSPTAWEHYLVLMLIPLVLITDAAMSRKASRRTIWTAAASYLFWPVQFILIILIAVASVGDVKQQALFLGGLTVVAQFLGCLAAYWFLTDRAPEFEARAAGVTLPPDLYAP